MLKTNILLVSRTDAVCAFFDLMFRNCEGAHQFRYASDEPGLRNKLQQARPDILLLDARFKENETPNLAAQLIREHHRLRITAFALDEYAPRAAAVFITRGVESFVQFRAGLKEIQQGIDLILHGKRYLPPAVERAVSERDMSPERRGALTTREREVGRLMAHGLTVPEIAERLAISPKTVDTHRSHIYEKTNSQRRSQFVAYAIRTGLLELEASCF